jgi:hypothetical protein
MEQYGLTSEFKWKDHVIWNLGNIKMPILISYYFKLIPNGQTDLSAHTWILQL